VPFAKSGFFYWLIATVELLAWQSSVCREGRGHDPSIGYPTVKDGIFIALRYFNETEYDAAKGAAYQAG
jgi:hypothetical protein